MPSAVLAEVAAPRLPTRTRVHRPNVNGKLKTFTDDDGADGSHKHSRLLSAVQLRKRTPSCSDVLNDEGHGPPGRASKHASFDVGTGSIDRGVIRKSSSSHPRNAARWWTSGSRSQSFGTPIGRKERFKKHGRAASHSPQRPWGAEPPQYEALAAAEGMEWVPLPDGSLQNKPSFVRATPAHVRVRAREPPVARTRRARAVAPCLPHRPATSRQPANEPQMNHPIRPTYPTPTL